jgi:D-alanyl-D-alanine carboxypeptidase
VLIGSGSSRRAQRSSTTDLLPRRRYAKSAAKGEACFRRRAEFKWLELLRQVAPGVSRLTIGQTSAPIKVEDRAGLGSAASCAAKLSGFLGADGMKTGFICASGFNLVASATRDGRRLIAVVLGAPSSQARAVKAAQLLERGFNTSGGLSWLMPSLGTVETMRPINAAPPNLRDEMCGPHRKRPATEDEDDVVAANVSSDSPYAVFLSGPRPKAKGIALLQDSVVVGEPAVVYTGPYRKPGTQTAATDPKPKAKAASTAANPKASTPAASQTPTEAAAGDARPKAASGDPKPASGDGKPNTAAAKSAPKDGAAAAAGATTSSDAAKPKKPAPKTTQAAQPMQITPTLTSQTR